jgi:hypothetical protein
VGDPTLENLQAYAAQAKKVSELCNNVLIRVPHMVQWDRKNRYQIILERVILVFFLGVVVAGASSVLQRIFNPQKPIVVYINPQQTNTPHLLPNQLNPPRQK